MNPADLTTFLDTLVRNQVKLSTMIWGPPGIGKSQLPRVPMTMFTLAELGTLVLDLMGIKKAHVLGASFGGAVAHVGRHAGGFKVDDSDAGRHTQV